MKQQLVLLHCVAASMQYRSCNIPLRGGRRLQGHQAEWWKSDQASTSAVSRT